MRKGGLVLRQEQTVATARRALATEVGCDDHSSAMTWSPLLFHPLPPSHPSARGFAVLCASVVACLAGWKAAAATVSAPPAAGVEEVSVGEITPLEWNDERAGHLSTGLVSGRFDPTPT